MERVRYTLEELMGEGELGVAPPGKLTVARGDKVRISVAFSYRGPALSVATLRCAIGNWGIFFDEIAHTSKNIGPIPASTDFLSYTAYADVDTSAIAAGVDYDIECKIEEYTSQTLVRQSNCIDVIGAAEFQNFRITDYSKAP